MVTLSGTAIGIQTSVPPTSTSIDSALGNLVGRDIDVATLTLADLINFVDITIENLLDTDATVAPHELISCWRAVAHDARLDDALRIACVDHIIYRYLTATAKNESSLYSLARGIFFHRKWNMDEMIDTSAISPFRAACMDGYLKPIPLYEETLCNLLRLTLATKDQQELDRSVKLMIYIVYARYINEKPAEWIYPWLQGILPNVLAMIPNIKKLADLGKMRSQIDAIFDQFLDADSNLGKEAKLILDRIGDARWTNALERFVAACEALKLYMAHFYRPPPYAYCSACLAIPKPINAVERAGVHGSKCDSHLLLRQARTY